MDADESAGSWCLIESDPAVFTELICDFGVKGLQVEELWSLDDESFERIGRIHGLIFLFKWMSIDFDGPGKNSVVQDSRLERIFFAKQVIQNACATQAIISILLNMNMLEVDSSIDIGPTLSSFAEFTQSFDPSMRGLALTNSEIIRSVHNSFARESIFEFEEDEHAKEGKSEEDCFHFVGFVPIHGRLYELDGLKEGPIDLGPVGDNWIKNVRIVLEERMAKYNDGGIQFNLMAVVPDRRLQLEKRLLLLESAEPEQRAQITELKHQIHVEHFKRQKYREENIRRKHNYLPLIMEFLKELAVAGELKAVYERAKTKTLEARVKALARELKKP